MELPFTYQTPDFIQELTKVTFPTHSSNSRIAKNGSRSSSTASKTTAVSRNAARERTRVKSLRTAFQNLQHSLPYVPPNTKLSKLDVLILATTYISHLMKILNQETTAAEPDYPDFASCHSKNIRSRMWETSYLHPVKKWPMRSRLYAGVQEEDPMNLSMQGCNRAFSSELGRQRRGLSL